VELIDDFLTWVDGLESRLSEDAAGAFMCLSTNVLEHIDPAIVSRSSCLKIDLPGLQERTAWWQAHAKQLPEAELLQLGSLTEGLSFRNLAQVVEKVERAAARQSDPAQHLHKCALSEYKMVAKLVQGEVACAATDDLPKETPTRAAKTPGWQVELEAERRARAELEERVKQLENVQDQEYWRDEDYWYASQAEIPAWARTRIHEDGGNTSYFDAVHQAFRRHLLGAVRG